MTHRLTVAAKVVFVLGGMSFLVVALLRALRDPALTVLPSPAAASGAVVLVIGALWAGAIAWSRLLDQEPSGRLVRGFLLAQLGKYLPGGVWQAIGQVRDAADVTEATTTRATTSLVASVVVTAAAGATVGAATAVLPNVPLWARIATPMGAIMLLAAIARPGWMASIVDIVPALRRRVDLADLPTRRQLVSAWLWTLPTLVVVGVVYAIALTTVTGELTPAVVPAFALAWTIGFLAIPFPAGLGIREAMLVVLVPGVGTTPLVAAAVIVRVLYIIGEVAAILMSTIAPRVTQSRQRG